MKHDSTDFLHELHGLVMSPGRVFGWELHWLAGCIDPEGAVVVTYRNGGSPVVHGMRYFVDEFSSRFDSALSTAQLAWIAFANEISEPDELGELGETDWAEGLVQEPSLVRWHGTSVVRSELRL